MQLPAVPLSQALRTLARVDQSFRRGDSRYSPLVTLTFTNGTALRGWVADLQESGREPSGLLQLAESNGQRSDAMAYFDPRQVVTVLVSDAKAIAVPLGGGAVDPLDGVEAPGRLAIQREAKELGGRLAAALKAPLEIAILWDSADTSSSRQMAAVNELVTLVGQELYKLAADDFAREAIGKTIRTISLAHGAERGAALNGTTLALTVPLDGGHADRFDAGTLSAALNKIL